MTSVRECYHPEKAFGPPSKCGHCLQRRLIEEIASMSCGVNYNPTTREGRILDRIINEACLMLYAPTHESSLLQKDMRGEKK